MTRQRAQRFRTSRSLLGIAVAEARKRPARVVVTVATVAFGTLVLTTALVLGASVQSAVDQGLKVEYPNVDVLMRAGVAQSGDTAGGGVTTPTGIAPRFLSALRALPEVQTVGTHVRTTSVAQVGAMNLGVTLESLNSAPRFQWQRISTGRAPAGADEVALSSYALSQLHVGLGDQVALSNPTLGRSLHRVVGVVDTRGAMNWQNSAYGLLDTNTALGLAGLTDPNTLEIQARPGANLDTLVNKFNAVAPIGLPQQASEIIAAGKSVQLGLVNALSIVVIVLAGISCLVAGITSATTTGASLASRRRSWALARCVGADGRMIGTLVAAESLFLGLLGALVGVFLGLGAARAALPAVGLVPGLPPIDSDAFTVTATAIYLPIVAAVGLALLAAIVPAWRAARIPPSAALQPNVEPAGQRSRLRLLVAVGALVAGAVVAVRGAANYSIPITAAGVVFFVVGASSLLSPMIVAVARALAGRTRSVDARLGFLDVVRRPRSAAIEAVALTTAVAIMTLSWVALASFEEATSARLTQSTFPDLTVGASNAGRSLSPATIENIRDIPGIADSVAIPFGQGVAITGRGPQGKVSVRIGTASGDARRWAQVLPGDLPVREFDDATVYLPTSSFPPFFDSSKVTLTGPNGTVRRLAVRYVDDLSVPSVVSAATLAKVSKVSDIKMLWLHLSPGSDRSTVVDQAQGIALLDGQQVSGPTVLDVRAAAAFASARAAAAAILSIAVVVAVVGAAATAALSVRERGREHATLRALGLSRRRLARMLGTRVLFVALMAAVQGVLSGTILGIVVAHLLSAGLGLAPAISLPVVPIVLVVVITVLAVRLAALAPTESASYIPVSRVLAEG